MGNECESGSCETSAGSCESSKGCACGNAGCSGEALDCAVGMWSCSFMTALKAVQVELLKERIRKAWGEKMNKVADGVVASMGAQWQSMVAQAQAKGEFRALLEKTWSEGRK